MLMQGAIYVNPFLLSLDAASQCTVLRLLGTKLFNLCIQINSLLSLFDLELGYVIGHLDVFQNVYCEERFYIPPYD